MDRRIAPAAAAAAVVLLVTAVVVTVGSRDDGPDSALPAAGPRPPSATSASSQAASPEPTRVDADASASPGGADPSAAPGQQTPASAPARPPSSPSTAPAAPTPRRTPAPSPAPRPASPAPSPSSPGGDSRSAFSFDSAYGTDQPREVVVQYGDSSSCPHQDVTYDVEESADRVVVTLEADTMPPERACTADYRQMLVPIRLGQPMGDRVLVDGSRGTPVEVDRSCSRPFANPPPPKDCDP